MFEFLGAHGEITKNIESTISRKAAVSDESIAFMDCSPANATIATRGKDGHVVGTATNGAQNLIFLGAIHGPFPEPFVGSTLDNPSKTAAALLERYIKRGDAFLDEVVGQFAVVLVDSKQDRLVLARDPYGGPRVFFFEGEDGVCFSTQLVDFADLLGPRSKLDRSLEDFLLGHEFLPDDRTLITGVMTLPKGKLMAWQNGKRQERPIQTLATPPDLLNAASAKDEGTVVKALYEAFMDSVRDQLPDKGKIGVLQGGFDSMLITAVLKKLGRHVETFTFRYPEEGYSQEMVEDFQSFAGVRHNWVDITPKVISDGLKHFATNFNQPVGQAHYLIASVHAAKLMQERGITHCLTGDGCDGLFLGYPTVYQRARFVKKVSSLRGLITPLVMFVGSSKWLEIKLGHPYRFIRNIARVISRSDPARGHIASCTLDSQSLRFLRRMVPPQDEAPETILRRLSEGLGDVEPLRLAYMGKGRVGLNAAKLEGMTRSSGIPMLSPYLHPRMVDVAAKIPDDLNRPSAAEKAEATGKYIFMQMVDQFDLLPSAFVHQRKMSPVTAPVDLWYWGALRESTLQRIKELPFDIDFNYAQSLVRPKAAERFFRRRIGISRYVCQAASLLATYAGFAKRLAKQSSQEKS